MNVGQPLNVDAFVLAQLLQRGQERQLHGSRALHQQFLCSLDVAGFDLADEFCIERYGGGVGIERDAQQCFAFRRLNQRGHLVRELRSLLHERSQGGDFSLDLRLVVQDEYIALAAHRIRNSDFPGGGRLDLGELMAGDVAE